MSGNIGPRKLVCAHIPLLAAMSDGGHGRQSAFSPSLSPPDDLFVKNHFVFSFLFACASCISPDNTQTIHSLLPPDCQLGFLVFTEDMDGRGRERRPSATSMRPPCVALPAPLPSGSFLLRSDLDDAAVDDRRDISVPPTEQEERAPGRRRVQQHSHTCCCHSHRRRRTHP